MKAADVMVSPVITADLEDSVQDVAEILLANGIGAVPVVGKDGELAGIISQADLINGAAKSIPNDAGRVGSRY